MPITEVLCERLHITGSATGRPSFYVSPTGLKKHEVAESLIIDYQLELG